jgi:citrate synthase
VHARYHSALAQNVVRTARTPRISTMATAAPANPVPTAKPVDTRGLANQVVGETKVCAVTQSELIYRGYEIADLAENATFEGVAHLVIVGHTSK